MGASGNKTRALLIIIFSFFPGALFADKQPLTLEAAQTLEKENKFDQAMAIYEEWLKDHAADPRFFSVLRRCGDLKKNPLAAIELYKSHAAGVNDAASRLLLYREIAILYTLLGDYRAAILNFHSAFPDGERLPPDDPWLAALPALCIASGETDAAYAWVKRADPFLHDPSLRADLNYSLLEIYLLRGDIVAADKAFAMLESGFAATSAFSKALLRMCRHHAERGERGQADAYRARLAKEFPGSLELAAAARLLSGKNGDGPKLSADAHDIIGGIDFSADAVIKDAVDKPEPEKGGPVPMDPRKTADTEKAADPPKGTDREKPAATDTPVEKKPVSGLRIQVGSYAMRENAVYMVRDLDKLGFKAEIVELRLKGRAHFRVFVGENLSAEAAQELLARLNDKGIGGYLFTGE
jgi:tetratricopeptide (TPR) repeat protein